MGTMAAAIGFAKLIDIIRRTLRRQHIVAAARIDFARASESGMGKLDAGIGHRHGDTIAGIAQRPGGRRTDQAETILIGVGNGLGLRRNGDDQYRQGREQAQLA